MTFDPTYEPREGLTHRDADWSGINVLVVGLGVSGFAAADALSERGARVTVVSRDATGAVAGMTAEGFLGSPRWCKSRPSTTSSTTGFG